MNDEDLAARLDDLFGRVAEAVERFRARQPVPDDPYRGLYVSDEKADRLLAGDHRTEARAAGAAADRPAPPDSALGRLACRFGLEPLDLAILVAVIGPDLDDRFELLYGYLHDDLTRKRCSAVLALELTGQSTRSAAARGRLGPSAPLIRGGLVSVESADLPFGTRPLRAPDRVVAHLLGDDSIEGNLLDVVIDPAPVRGEAADRLTRALAVGLPVYIRERTDVGAAGAAVAALHGLGRSRAVVVDLSRIHSDEVRRAADDVVRECRLVDAGLVCQSADSLHPSVIRRLAGAPLPVVLVGRQPWDPAWSDGPAYPFALEAPDEAAQDALWRQALDGNDLPALGRPQSFRLGPERIGRAVATARAVAADEDAAVAPRHLVVGARTQNTVGLTGLATRIEPAASWDDIVLAAEPRSQLEHLAARVEHRATVLDQWGLRRGGGRGEGIIGLFAGDSGTGKTLAAEIIAGALDLDLYVIDLSTVVDKYIGETEKNLERIFAEAEGVNGILFFDEADALFGKRTDVSDARDRYANVEVAYLLQRLESFDGLGILATNLRANIDDAFARRLSVVVEFPDPDETARRALWGRLGQGIPFDDDVDLDFLAKAFELRGGNIRNIVVSAAYLGAAGSGTVSMRDVIRATQLEYRKLGRLCNDSEFGPYVSYLGLEGEFRARS